MIASARWIFASALERTESRGLHRRSDYPDLDPTQHQHVVTGGLDDVLGQTQNRSAILISRRPRHD